MTHARRSVIRLVASLAAGALVVGTPLTAEAAPVSTHPSGTAPSLLPALAGYSAVWRAAGGGTLRGTVVDRTTLERDDALTVWINRNATKAERFTALQDSEYDDGTATAPGTGYDQSLTVSTGLGPTLSRVYVALTHAGRLPRTQALINSSTGTTGAYVRTGDAKKAFSHPRPYLPTDPTAALPAGDDQVGCAPSTVNAASQASIRKGEPWADVEGNLLIERVAPVVDTTHRFSPHDVSLDAAYGTAGLCQGGSFPSGHTTTAYEAGITLATLVPELAPEILARASENGNDRIVLGVHYPLDVMGGRIAGEVALTARWSDATFRDDVLLPAREELLHAFAEATGHPLEWTIAHERPYTSDPYGGNAMPGGTAQIVSDRSSAVQVFTERLTYGFPATGETGRAASVPPGAENLLRTTFPTLSDSQRRSLLAQTELDSGSPLDGTGTATGSFQRLNLAAAMSATVAVDRHADVTVVATGGAAHVVCGYGYGHR